MNAIDCEHLTRTFGKTTALRDVNFSVPAGSFFALLGPNGAGKSTTLKILLNLISPSHGRAMVLGKPSTELNAADFRKIGYIAEGQDLPDWMTCQQLVDYCRTFYPNWDADLVARLRKDFRVPMDRPIKKMSRGQRMQAALLSTLPYRPELLILDEPFSGLDPLVRDDLIQGLLELPADDRPRTMVISSHDIDEVERLTDEVAFLAESKLLVRESAESLHSRFRRIEVTAQGAIDANREPEWYEYRLPAPNVAQFTIGNYSAESEARLGAAFRGANVSVQAMTLREIFVVLARHERRSTELAA